MTHVGPAVGLIPLTTYTAEAARPSMVWSDGAGIRMMVPVVDSTWTGRLSGKQAGPSGGDSISIGADGTARTSVELCIRTESNADVQVRYQGRADWSDGPTSEPVRIAVSFSTGEPSLQWLNTVFAVGVGRFDGKNITYELFELRSTAL